MKAVRLLAAGIGGLLLALGGAASAQDDYPTRPVKLVIPAAPGGPTDLPARIASQILGARLGQPVVVENRPGAGGALGARAVATAPADGYTLLVGNTSTLAVIPAVSASAGYDALKDFAPIVRMSEGFQILIVRGDAPWKTAKELAEDSKANPSKINYAHSGPGGLPHLAGEIFMLRSGAKLTGVPYRSGGEALNAVLGGAVHATFESIAILRGQISEGKVRALGAQNRARTPLLPDMPTMAETVCRGRRPTASTAWSRPPARRRRSSTGSPRPSTKGWARPRSSAPSSISAARRSPIRRRSSPPTSPRRSRSGARSARAANVAVN